VDIALEGGRVVEIAKGLSRRPAQRVINAQGLIATPGLIDPHVHLREPGNERAETIASGTWAGVSGGFTALCCMPNTTPALDNDVMVRFVLERAEATGHCRVFPVAAATKDRKGVELAELELMARAGAVGFSDDGDCVASSQMMQRVLTTARATGRCFMQHCQDHDLSRGGVMHAGEVASRLGLGGWPRAAEEIIIDRDVRLNTPIGCAYHVQHMSSGGSAEIVRRARAAGQPVTCEVTPHHLLLTCDLIEQHSYDTRFKMNPPLRERSDAAALLDAVADGTVTVLGTDHAPHTSETKLVPFDAAAFGIVGLETALALYIKALIEPGVIDWPRLIAMMTTAPAALCGLDRPMPGFSCGLGRLQAGGPADLTLIDPSATWTINADDLVGKSKNSPFIGQRVRGRSVATVVAGHVRHERARD
jgi:dihydroorotase